MIVLMLGSGPSATRARDWPRAPFDRVVAINNAWRVRDDWDHLVYPFDFPSDRMPPKDSGAGAGHLIDQSHFVPAQNAYGGFVFGGATMAFTATYWALHALKPTVIAYLGCDMVYTPTGPTHFYGTGTADPLRSDMSLRSLEAKSARAAALAAREGCALVNLSTEPSRLAVRRAQVSDIASIRPPATEDDIIDRALHAEAALGYTTPTGFHDHITDPDLDALDAIDRLWMRSTRARETA
ncbi:MAG: hypothetical protein AAFO93_06555 [Pseudomonadota bacterium]